MIIHQMTYTHLSVIQIKFDADFKCERILSSLEQRLKKKRKRLNFGEFTLNVVVLSIARWQLRPIKSYKLQWNYMLNIIYFFKIDRFNWIKKQLDGMEIDFGF